MGIGVTGTYEGEGPNVASGLATTANVPDVPTQNKQRTATGQGAEVGLTMDIRRRARTSSESARDETAVNVASADQVLSKAARGIYVGGTGNLVCRLVDAAADSTFQSLSAGVVYPFAVAIIRKTGTTITNSNVLF